MTSPRWLRAGRIGPIVAGLAGFGAFVAELAPQANGFADTDDPSVSLRFVAAHPTDWAIAGVLFIVTSLALIVAVIAINDRLAAAARADATGDPGVGRRSVTVVGLFSAGFLFGHGVIRLAGGPMLYVDSLDGRWGETAYLVTQFVGVHLLAQGGILLLTIWILGVAWLAAARRALPRPVALLALIPGFRLLGLLGPWDVLPDGLWIFFMAAIPAGFLWLVLVGLSSADTLASRAARPAGVLEASEAAGS